MILKVGPYVGKGNKVSFVQRKCTQSLAAISKKKVSIDGFRFFVTNVKVGDSLTELKVDKVVEIIIDEIG